MTAVASAQPKTSERFDGPEAVKQRLGAFAAGVLAEAMNRPCLLYTSPSPRDRS